MTIIHNWVWWIWLLNLIHCKALVNEKDVRRWLVSDDKVLGASRWGAKHVTVEPIR